MTRLLIAFILAACVLLLARCGGAPSPAKGRIKELIVFSAPWCAPCKHEVPLIASALKGAPGVTGVLFIETGPQSFHPPTQEDAEAYGTLVGWPNPPLPDPWRYVTYRKYFPKADALPAAVALDDKGQVVSRFGPGQIAAEIALYLRP